MPLSRALLVAGSPVMDFSALQPLIQTILQAHPAVKVIAIDRGLEICHKLGLEVFKILGDFDSVDTGILKGYPKDLIMDFPPEKDQSDTELALDFSIQAGFDEILLVNAAGGRMDHFLFNALLLFHHQATIKLFDDTGTLLALPLGDTNFNLPNGTIFSLIPLEKCTGVSVSGAKYPLQNATLQLNSRTLSNVVSPESRINIHVGQGHLLFYTDTWIM
ncbi:MAG: thiamine diphosphokinase [Promethearchaeota archaeon]